LTALALLWLGSWLLTGVALAVVIGLILARLFAERRSRRGETLRRVYVAQLLGTAPIGAVPGRPADDILTDVSLELARMVRGEDREALLARAKTLRVPERLRRRLRRGRVQVRLGAAEALAHFHDDESLAALRGALDDGSSHVRLTAALALAQHDASLPVSMLVERLGIGTREHSRIGIELLREIGRHRPEEVAALLWQPNVPAGAKAAAAEALMSSAHYDVVPLIAELALNSSDESAELPAYIEALGGLGHPAAAAAVLNELHSSQPRVRAAAAAAAGRIGIFEAAERLAALVGDAHWQVRFQAATALSRLGPNGRKLLEKTAADGEPLARQAAATILAEQALER
jgi:HEAT repeat protein